MVLRLFGSGAWIAGTCGALVAAALRGRVVAAIGRSGSDADLQIIEIRNGNPPL